MYPIFWMCVCSLRCPAWNAHGAILSSVAGPAVLYFFFTFSHKGHNFRKNSYWTQNTFWISLQRLSETFPILRRNERDKIINVERCSYTQMWMKLEFMLYAFFWIIPRSLEFICGRFGTLCLFRLHRQVDVSRMNSFLVHSTHIYLPMKTEQTECSETSEYKRHTPGNYPKESIQHT
jgi:hypothetical protein